MNEILETSITELNKVNKKLALLTKQKEQLTEAIISAIGHDHPGQKGYEYDVWKVTVKTPMTYSLDTRKYKAGDVYIPDGFNPIKESITYTVDKKLADKYMNESPESVREALGMLITIKPGKASITIEARA